MHSCLPTHVPRSQIGNGGRPVSWKPLVASQTAGDSGPVHCSQMGWLFQHAYFGLAALLGSGVGLFVRWDWDSFSYVKEGYAVGCTEICGVKCVST